MSRRRPRCALGGVGMPDDIDLLVGDRDSGRELVHRYTARLVGLARRQLPQLVRRRVDPEDVVQSVYRSFFRGLHEGRFVIADPEALWRLLASMTFHKARNAAKFHQRRCRDVRRDCALAGEGPPEPTGEDVDALMETVNNLLAGLPETHQAIVARRL